MKQYVVDELRPADYEALKTFLDDHYGKEALDGVYWIPIIAEVLTEVQKAHRECGPHYAAVDLDHNRLACELLVRSKNRVRCSCVHYTTAQQRNWLIEVIDSIFSRLEIKT